MKPILEKKGFKLFFHNKATDKTLPVGWTGTSKGMITKCKKLLRENEGSHFEYTFQDEVNFKVDIEALAKLIDKVYAEVDAITDPQDTPEEVEAAKELPKHITEPHAVKHQAAPKHLLCSSKNCNHEILISGNLEYRHGTKIYLVCPECGHKTKVHKVDTTNSLSYAVGAENKGTLIRPDGPKKHMNKKARLRIKRREN